jgi:hypothetical protein
LNKLNPAASALGDFSLINNGFVREHKITVPRPKTLSDIEQNTKNRSCFAGAKRYDSQPQAALETTIVQY